MRYQSITFGLKSTWLFASFILIALVSSIGVAQVDTWTRKADIPTARNWLGTTAVNGKIYAIGGLKSTGGLGVRVASTVEAYDPATDTWIKKADMPTARDDLSTIAIGGKIYAIGGFIQSSQTILSTVEVYDPTTDSWETKADMPTRRFLPATAVVDGKIYVIGGIIRLGDGAVSLVEMYDPATDTWTRKADMPTARGWSGNNPPVVDGKIYVIGGWVTFQGRPLATVEEYETATDTWSGRAAMPTARAALETCMVDGKIYALGGFTTSFDVQRSTVERYDPKNDRWERTADIPTARGAHAASTVNGIIYVIGGWNGALLSTVEAYDTGVGIRIQAISPIEGSPTGGEPIAMSGTGFPPDAIVTIGGKPLINLEVINDTVISGLTPPGTLGEHDYPNYRARPEISSLCWTVPLSIAGRTHHQCNHAEPGATDGGPNRHHCGHWLYPWCVRGHLGR